MVFEIKKWTVIIDLVLFVAKRSRLGAFTNLGSAESPGQIHPPLRPLHQELR